MFFNSIQEIDRLRKEINRLLSKGMSIIYLKLLLRKSDVLVSGSVFGELQLTQISLNFQATYCNIIIILKGIMTF